MEKIYAINLNNIISFEINQYLLILPKNICFTEENFKDRVKIIEEKLK